MTLRQVAIWVSAMVDNMVDVSALATTINNGLPIVLHSFMTIFIDFLAHRVVLLLLNKDDIVHVHVAIRELPTILNVILTGPTRGRDCALAVDHLNVAGGLLQVLFHSIELLLMIWEDCAVVLVRCHWLLRGHRWLDDLVSDVDLPESERVVAVLLVGL